MQIVGTTSLNYIFNLSNWLHVCITCCSLSNSQFYCWRYLSLAATRCHSHALSLSLSLHYLTLFPLLSVWYKTSGIYFQLINWIDEFHERTVLISKVTSIWNYTSWRHWCKWRHRRISFFIQGELPMSDLHQVVCDSAGQAHAWTSGANLIKLFAAVNFEFLY